MRRGGRPARHQRTWLAAAGMAGVTGIARLGRLCSRRAGPLVSPRLHGPLLREMMFRARGRPWIRRNAGAFRVSRFRVRYAVSAARNAGGPPVAYSDPQMFASDSNPTSTSLGRDPSGGPSTPAWWSWSMMRAARP